MAQLSEISSLPGSIEQFLRSWVVPLTDPDGVRDGRWPNGRPVMSSQQYESTVWGPVYQASQTLLTRGSGNLGDDQAGQSLLEWLGRNKQLHGVQ